MLEWVGSEALDIFIDLFEEGKFPSMTKTTIVRSAPAPLRYYHGGSNRTLSGCTTLQKQIQAHQRDAVSSGAGFALNCK
jgi:hypothetical protein